MRSLDDLYFGWLLDNINDSGVTEGVSHLAGLLHRCEFHRRVGNDVNRAIDGVNLRKEFLYDLENEGFVASNTSTGFLDRECSWLEMLIALAKHLDFIYDGGVEGRMVEMITNLKLDHIAASQSYRSTTTLEFDQEVVYGVVSAVNKNQITKNGYGGLFPLKKRSNQDQRLVEIWEQQAAYFRERLEGGMWTSIM